jgi:hypothetical protein
MKTWRLVFIISMVAMLAALPVAAQTGDSSTRPAEGSEPPSTINVTGQIVNGTEGAAIPGNLELMVHVWDAGFNEKDMIHGQADGHGRFQFDDVPYESGLSYAVMVAYQGANYFSAPMDVAEGETILELEVPVFEATSDASDVKVAAMHLFFDVDQGGLMVSEIYSLSNLGDRTVVGATTLDDGTPATMRFSLPPDAASVNFQGNQSRFFLTDDGFADTAPLLSGSNVSQVIVTYVLPYSDGLTLNRTVAFPIEEVSILLQPSLGLSLDETGFIARGQRDVGQGMVVDIYSLENLEAGASFSLGLSGKLDLSGGAPMAVETGSSRADGLAVGGMLLGLAVIGAGIWWYRRPPDGGEEFPGAFEDIVQEIALLDAAHDGHEIDDETYHLRRTALREQAKAVLAQSGD